MNTTYSPSTNRISREFFEDALRERGVGSMYEAVALAYEIRANVVGFVRTDDARAWFSMYSGNGGRYELGAKARARRGR